MNSDSYTTNYDDAGTYTVTVSVSDGSLLDSQDVTVNVNDIAIMIKLITAGDIDGNGQKEIIVDYGPVYGIWAFMNNSTWKRIHSFSSESMTTGDIDGNGQDEVIIGFGGSNDIQIIMNNGT